MVLRWYRGALWARAYDCGKHYNDGYSLTGEPVCNLVGVYRFKPGLAEATTRYYWGDSPFGYIDRQDGPLTKGRWHIPNPFYANAEYGVGYSVIGLDEIQKSPFRYCMVEDAKREFTKFLHFLTACCFYPRQIEMLMKARMSAVVRDLVERGVKHAAVIDWNESNPAKAFGLSRQDMKTFLDTSRDIEILELHKKLKGRVPLTECADWIAQLPDIRGTFKEAKKWNLPPEKLMRYLAGNVGCGRYGGLSSLDAALRFWRDYITAAEAMGYQLHHENVLLPRNLGAAHDEATKKHQKQLDRERQAAQREQERKWKAEEAERLRLAHLAEENYEEYRIKLEEKYGQVNTPGSAEAELEDIRRLAQTANETANAAKGTATTAQQTAEAALEAANGAVTEAGNAKTAADEAKELAQGVSSTASEALKKASAAEETANGVSSKVDEALQAAQNAQQSASAALAAVKKLTSTINAVPSQSGTLTYSGSPQTPSWNNYDPEQLTLEITAQTNAGTYTAKFTPKGDYEWAEGGKTAKTVQWTIKRATVAVPAQSGSLTYTGTALNPAWSNYDTAKLTIGGTTSGTNAGNYNATFTPKDNYQWSDGTYAAKTVVWVIAKAAGSLSISPTSLALDVSALSKTITVTRAGDGAITVQSSNTAAAEVSLSGTTITVKGKAKGSATITVKVAAGTNHTAPADKTCSVTVTMPTTTMKDNSWETIGQVSAAGQGASYWSVGDTKSITINGKVGETTFTNLAIDVFIIGFNHNSAKEGANRIHWLIGKISGKMVGLCDSKYNNTVSTTGYFSMNSSATNVGGWEASYRRKTLYGNDGTHTPTNPLANSLMAALPSDLRAVMKSVTKYSDNKGNHSSSSQGVASDVTATTDYLADLAEFEIHGTRQYANQYEQNQQQQYDYFKSGNSKVAYRHDNTSTAVWWFGRSALYTSYYNFTFTSTDGSRGSYYAYNSSALVAGFFT